MKPKMLSLLALLSFASHELFSQNKAFQAYIDKFTPLALTEMDRVGIPASIKLAQGLLESDAGRSDLATKANNHFGIKCGNDWDGKTFSKIDDDRDIFGRPIPSCFRHYKSAEESFIAHSEFLSGPARRSRYGFLFDLDITDYKGWASGLRRAGYATAPDYANKLIDLIERYKLHEIDRMTSAPIAKPSKPDAPPIDRPLPPAQILVNNDVRYVVSQSQATVAKLAEIASVSVRDVLRYNENLTSTDQLVEAGTMVYLQPKRNAYRGREIWHVVRSGETMMDISIAYGISLAKLHDRNLIEPHREPLAGQRIKLRGARIKQAPQTYSPKTPALNNDMPANVIMNEDAEKLDMEISPQASSSSQTSANGDRPVREDPFHSSSTSNGTNAREEDEEIMWPAEDNIATGHANDSIGMGNGQALFHLVQAGETLWGIANRYGRTVEELRQLNNLSSNVIQQGIRLRVR
jgi:LysM repeat protein